MVPATAFTFRLLEPPEATLKVFREAARKGSSWPSGIPLPILTYHADDRMFGIMDGMMRIRSAQLAGIPQFRTLVASGETYDELMPILDQGYYGEDFVEMLCLVNPEVRKNQQSCNRNRLAGL